MNAKQQVPPGDVVHFGGREVAERPRDPGEPGPCPEGRMEIQTDFGIAARRHMLLHEIPYRESIWSTLAAHAAISLAAARVEGTVEWFVQYLR